MNKFVLLIFALLIFGCTEEREKMLADYIKTAEKEKKGIYISIKKIEDLESISARDSITFLEKDYIRVKDDYIDHFTEIISLIRANLEEKEKMVSEIKSDGVSTRNYSNPGLKQKVNELTNEISLAHLKITLYSDQLEKVKNDNLDAIENEKAGDLLLNLININYRIKQYKKAPDAVLANKCKVTYKIKSHLFDNTRQEITRYFLLSIDNTRVMGEVKDR